jgi:hypothetical protein
MNLEMQLSSCGNVFNLYDTLSGHVVATLRFMDEFAEQLFLEEKADIAEQMFASGVDMVNEIMQARRKSL